MSNESARRPSCQAKELRVDQLSLLGISTLDVVQLYMAVPGASRRSHRRWESVEGP